MDSHAAQQATASLLKEVSTTFSFVGVPKKKQKNNEKAKKEKRKIKLADLIAKQESMVDNKRGSPCRCHEVRGTQIVFNPCFLEAK